MNTEKIQKLFQTWDLSQLNDRYGVYSRLPSWQAASIHGIKMFESHGTLDDFHHLNIDAENDDAEIDVVTVEGQATTSADNRTYGCTAEFFEERGNPMWSASCGCGAPHCVHTYFLLVEAKKQFAADVVPLALLQWGARYNLVPREVASPARDVVVGLVMRSDLSGISGTLPMPIATLLLGPPGSATSRKPAQIGRNLPNLMDRLKPTESSKLALLEMTKSRAVQGQRDSQPYSIISSYDQEFLFDEILRDGRAYLDKFVGQPLRRGEDVVPTHEWSSTGAHRQQLRLLFPDLTPVKMAVRLRDLWYCQDGTMGRLLGDAGFLSMVMNMPPVDDTQLPTVSSWWKKQAFAARLPAPTPLQSIRDVNVPPDGVLTLRFIHVPAQGDQPEIKVPIADLTLDYAGVSLTDRHFTDGFVIRRLGDETVKIHRDADRQNYLMGKLLASGLDFASSHPAVRTQTTAGDASFVNTSLNSTADDIEHFARAIDRCEAAGFRIVLAADFPLVDVDGAKEYKVLTSSDTMPGDSSSWFDLDVGIEIDGRRHNLGKVVSATFRDIHFNLKPQPKEPENARWTVKLEDGQLVRIPLSVLRHLVAPIAEWMDGSTKVKDGKVRLGKLQAAIVAEDLGAEAPRVLAQLRKGISRLREIATAPMPRTSPGFQGELRPYQSEGFRWLNGLAEAGLGGILADDMGLGKTLEVLAHVLHRKDIGKLNRPVLVVVPKSLVFNWHNEAAKFAPSLRVLVLHGQSREGLYASIEDNDLVLTTYNVLPRDIRLIEDKRFSLVVLDESQQVKNPTVQAGKAVRRLNSDAAVCLTGTPVENHLLDLWSQMDIALPGLLGEQREFKRIFGTPIEKHRDMEKQARLNKRIHPFILRRTKEQVALDLPPKTESTIGVELEGDQQLLYESLRAAMSAEVQQAIAEKGLANSGVIILAALLKLRQACCHPQLVDLPSAKTVKGSVKLDMLLDMLSEAAAEGRRVLVFSSFTSMLDLIAAALKLAGIQFLTITGKTQKREPIVRHFQEGTVPVFLLSLKAAGVGLNLTAADTVIHYDPWWNPAAENQATDRAHRIGQTKPIMVYRLICEGTIESKIQELKKRKGALADAILDGASTTLTGLTEQDVADLFAKA